MFYYAHSFSRDAPQLPPQVLEVLVEAHLQAPQVGQIALEAGRELMLAGRWDEAVSSLNMFARYSHGGEAANRANELLQAARRHEPPPAPPPADASEN